MKKKVFSIFLMSILFSYCSDNTILTYAITDFPEKLEPYYNLFYDGSQIASQIYEKLVILDNDCKTIKPHLAEKWVISDDKKEYTFYLRKNINFHDGTKLSSYSVEKSYEWFRHHKEKPDIFNRIESIKIIDSIKFQIRLRKPYSILLFTLAAPQCFEVMSERSIENYDSTVYYQLAGSGPYYLSDYKKNNFIILKKNKNYWGEKSKIDQVNFVYYKDGSNITKDFEENKIDLKFIVSANSIDRLLWKGNIKYKTGLPIDMFFFGFNNQAYPFNNKKVRKAILKAIDIPKLVYNINRGNAIIAKGPLPPSYFKYKYRQQDNYEPDYAKRMLIEHEINNIQINFDYTKAIGTRLTFVEFLEYELEKVNIDLNLRAYNSWKEFDRALLDDSVQMFYYGGRSDYIGDAYDLLYSFFYSSSKLNFCNYKNPLVDLWLDDALLEDNKTKRDILYEKIVNQILEDTPAIFYMHVIPNFAYNCNRIKTLTTDPYEIIDFAKTKLN